MDWFHHGITDISVLATRVTKHNTSCLLIDGVDRSI